MDNPQNELEFTLVAGASDKAARPRFYEVLLKSEVLIVPAGEKPPIVGGIVQASVELSLSTIEVEGKPHIPFFSSEVRLTPGAVFIRLSAVDFFRMTTGSSLVLNPGSGYGKAFLPGEIESLLDGSFFRPNATVTAPAGTMQQIGQPKDYPYEFAAAVARFLESEAEVEQAFLAQHIFLGIDTRPTILVAVIAPAPSFERIGGAIGRIWKETQTAARSVDIIRVQKDSLGYFANQTPIYKRRKKGLFAKLFR